MWLIWRRMTLFTSCRLMPLYVFYYFLRIIINSCQAIFLHKKRYMIEVILHILISMYTTQYIILTINEIIGFPYISFTWITYHWMRFWIINITSTDVMSKLCRCKVLKIFERKKEKKNTTKHAKLKLSESSFNAYVFIYNQIISSNVFVHRHTKWISKQNNIRLLYCI